MSGFGAPVSLSPCCFRQAFITSGFSREQHLSSLVPLRVDIWSCFPSDASESIVDVGHFIRQGSPTCHDLQSSIEANTPSCKNSYISIKYRA
ncbi:hypothetical protein QN277_013780 [Acacia crassicarpa]|uniref:Uncharacterized protein n=1 Tax=Acacia crassicarpa TaxID=499986 RepID=A0AAE1N351_9FABA|nr:hypothetical protein QN277_013780 [Acacia crassicarpa]